ncbi:MAG: MBL fold metallo-hydrolase [Gemmatimonadota bacterium]|nr:MBL fold metallo-hydrolase [Gemmatimonadota bacterium]
MLRVTILGSGSRGNATLVEGQDTTVLIDNGFNPRALKRRLATIGRHPQDVQALLLTHEHTDHASGAIAACAQFKWPLHATTGTLGALPESAVATISISVTTPFCVGGLSVQAAHVPHDAREAIALVITDRTTGCRIGIATDLGHVPETLPKHFERLDVLIVESNHDERMLAEGPYPAMLKRRIASRLGHLSNRQAASFIATCVHSGLKNVVLAHLSETNNTPDVAVLAATNALRKAGWRKDSVWAAHQSEIRGPYATMTNGFSARAVQLGFAL